MIAALLAGVLAHYIEIHFGIAIASTRTMFWAFAGMLVVVGSGWVHVEETAPVAATCAAHPKRARRPRRQMFRATRNAAKQRALSAAERPTSTARPMPTWVGSVAGYAFIGAVIFSTLFYEFITNAERLSDPVRIFWRALTFVSVRNMTSYAVLGMIGLVWILATTIAISEMARAGVFKKSGDWLSGAALFASLSMGVAVIFGLGLASQLGALTRVQAARVEDMIGISDRVAGILNYYYIGVFLLILLAGATLLVEMKHLPAAWSAPGGWGLIAILPAILVAFFWINYSNLNPIRADIVYKQADPWDRQGQWDVSIAHYKHAIDLVPTEDFYYLWLGRAFLEKAKTAKATTTPLFNDQTQLEGILNLNVQQTAGLGQTDLLLAARAVLTRAREINPLNTDHSANLARLMRTWADMTTDPAQKSKLADQASQYYVEATRLSPHNAILWNEWATIDLYLKGDPDDGAEKARRISQPGYPI